MRIEELRALAAARTRGRWDACEGDVYARSRCSQITVLSGCHAESGLKWARDADVEFVAHTANHIDALLDVVDAAKNAVNDCDPMFLTTIRLKAALEALEKK